MTHDADRAARLFLDRWTEALTAGSPGRRVRTMSCCAAIDETLHLADTWVRSGGRTQPAVDPLEGGHGVAMLPDVAAEAAHLVREDPTLADRPEQREVVASLIESLRKDENRTPDRVEQLRSLLGALRGDYVGHAFDRVRALCDTEPKKQEELHALSNAIVSELRSRGWSDDALIHVARFAPGARARERIEGIAGSVRNDNLRFACFVAISASEDLGPLNTDDFVIVAEVPTHARVGRTLSSGPYARVTLHARDVFSAAAAAHLRVQSVVGAAAVFLPRTGLRVASTIVAVEHETQLHVIDVDHTLVEENRSASAEDLRRIAQAAWTASARPSADPLYDAIRLRHRAQISGDSESRLLLLWSAIERITSGARGFGGALSAARVLTSKAIALGKVRRDVGDLAATMEHDLEGAAHAAVLALIGGYKDKKTGREQIDRGKLLARLLGPRDELDEVLKSFYDEKPLLVRRCFTLWTELGSGSTSLKSRCDAIVAYHERARERVDWQIGRIYRARNRIAHVGVGPDRLRDLVWHAHFYCTQLVAICIHYGGQHAPPPQEQLLRRAGSYDAFIALLRAEDAAATTAEALDRPMTLFGRAR